MAQLPVVLPSGSTSRFDAIRRVDEEGEYWRARDLMRPLGYGKWQRFASAIERAKLSCANSGADVVRHFTGAGKVIKGGRWGEVEVADYRLTRHAAYLIALNGDPRKSEIAAAHAYFAVKTREAELVSGDRCSASVTH